MAWSNLGTKTDAVDTFAAADVNTLMENIRVVAGNGNNAPSDNCTNLNTRVTVLEGGGLDEYAAKTLASGGFWGDIVWQDADQIQIKAKAADGLSPFVGAYLNDGTFIRLSINTDFIYKYDTPANSGHILDGITAKLNNEWHIIWAYKDSGNALAFGSTWMPNDTFTNANPTNTLTLSQVNGQDIGFLFPVDSHVVCWQDTDEWETPLAWQNAGAVTYDATKDKPKISSRTATVLTLGANLENNNFTANSRVYQVDGFKPLQVADGAIAAEIGARGYFDIKFRFRTDGSGNIYHFEKHDTLIILSPSSILNTELTAGTITNYLTTYAPPDCMSMYAEMHQQDTGVAAAIDGYIYPYYNDNPSAKLSTYGSGGQPCRIPVRHGLLRAKGGIAGVAVFYIFWNGWFID